LKPEHVEALRSALADISGGGEVDIAVKIEKAIYRRTAKNRVAEFAVLNASTSRTKGPQVCDAVTTGIAIGLSFRD
jgi:hypothetical protein